MSIKKILFLYAILCSFSYAFGEIDTYRTSQFTEQEASQLLHKELQGLKKLSSELGVSGKFEKNEELYKLIFVDMYKKVNSLGDFAFVRISPLFYLDGSIMVSLDVVDKKDKDRLAFINDKKTCDLPTRLKPRLSTKFKQFEDMGHQMFYRDRHVGNKNRSLYKCKALHCLFDAYSEEMKELDDYFFEVAPKEKQHFIEVIHNSCHSEDRIWAIYLLAYYNDAQFVIDHVADSLRDKDSGVRNAAGRTLAAIIRSFEPHTFPFKVIEAMIDGPEETDRNKALAVMYGLIQYKQYRDRVQAKTLITLVHLLQSKQMNINDYAYEVLKKLSHKHFKKDDIELWKAWAKRI